MQRVLMLHVFVLLVTAGCTAAAPPETTPELRTTANKQFLLTYPNLADPNGEVLLENDFVVVQRFVVQPGEWEGLHAHPGNQVYIHIKGGIWSGRRGGVQRDGTNFSEAGSVGWMEPIPLSERHESGNTGDTPIDLIWVTLKKDGPVSAPGTQFLLDYPNLADPDGELLLENERVVVQRFVVQPGEWEGLHAHPGNQVYIHIKGGIWSGRRGGVQRDGTNFSEAGSVGWMEPIPLSERHESGNTGNTPIDLIWVTLK